MSLDIFFRDDIARILASTTQATSSALSIVTPHDPALVAAYERGFDDAVQAIATAFGVTPPGAHARRPSPGTRSFAAASQRIIDADHSTSRDNGRPYPTRGYNDL